MAEDWAQKVAFMRQNGVIRAEWSQSNGALPSELLRCELGSVPIDAAPIEESEPAKIEVMQPVFRHASRLIRKRENADA